MKNIGVIIARFQTPFLHEGHIQLINEVASNHNRIVVLLGVSPVRGSRKNPYDYATRERLLKNTYPDLMVLPISDHPSDATWSKDLDTLLNNTFPGNQFLLYGSRDSFIPYYTGKFETLELPEHGDYNATEIREKYADKVFESQDFRAGILYGVNNQYTKVNPTVDVAVFRNDKTEILLGKKATNHKWRFIGGFSDPEDDGFEQAALRELQEEAGPIEVGQMTYVTSRKIDDWRYRSEADKIITTLFCCDFIDGTPVAQDDIIDLDWIKVDQLENIKNHNDFSPEHLELLDILLVKLKNNQL